MGKYIRLQYNYVIYLEYSNRSNNYRCCVDRERSLIRAIPRSDQGAHCAYARASAF
jgi:hypothetical protein